MIGRYHCTLLAALLVLGAGSAAAETCTPETLGAAVDAAGVELRALNAEAQPRLKQKITALKDKKKWSDADYEQKVGAFMHDARTAQLDAKADELLTKIDTLGRPEPGTPVNCAAVDEVKASGSELLAVMKTKSAYVTEKIDRELGLAPAAKEQPPKRRRQRTSARAGQHLHLRGQQGFSAGQGRQGRAAGRRDPAADPEARRQACAGAEDRVREVVIVEHVHGRDASSCTTARRGLSRRAGRALCASAGGVLEQRGRLHHRRDPRSLARLLRHHLDLARAASSSMRSASPDGRRRTCSAPKAAAPSWPACATARARSTCARAARRRSTGTGLRSATTSARTARARCS